ncbi:hypothetical protein [Streptomyces ziwulingensis]|uniref:Uncharacterized protein n=1 Tax=Streptomyces ziwulingensis TaxID=1045501 RepID=A0ABP9D3D3_9ACTN
MKARHLLAALALLGAGTLPAQAAAADGDAHVEGRLPSGATYLMDVPAAWNGTVLLHSHGYRATGWPDPAQNAPGTPTRDDLLGSLSMRGLLQGGVADWNSTLDPVFTLRTLLAPGVDRISADRTAVRWMRDTGVFSGRLTYPQLTLHTTGDGTDPRARRERLPARGRGGGQRSPARPGVGTPVGDRSGRPVGDEKPHPGVLPSYALRAE